MKSEKNSTPVTFECAFDISIFCNEPEIEQVIINLINNAIDAVSKLEEKWVKLELTQDEQNTILRVIDSGAGISEEIKEKLFNPFFTTKKIGEGTGLGLSITKGILNEHSATITLMANSPNTCFEIKFPKGNFIYEELQT